MSVCNWNLKTGKYFELSCQKLNYQLVSWDVVCKEETKFQSVVSVPHLNFKPIPIASPPDSVKTTHSLCWAMPCQVLRFENLIRHLPQGEIVAPVRYHQISPSIYPISPDITCTLQLPPDITRNHLQVQLQVGSPTPTILKLLFCLCSQWQCSTGMKIEGATGDDR